MDFEDPFVRRICETIVSVACVVLLFLCSVSLGIVLDWYWGGEQGPGSNVLVRMAQILPKLTGPEADELANIVAIALSAAPIAVTAICVSNIDNVRRINAFGKVVSILLLVCAFESLLGYVLINPSLWGDGHTLGQRGLEEAQQWAKATLRASLFYLATILGLRLTR